MPALTLSSVNKILVVGPIWDKIDKLSTVEKLLTGYDWIILNGGACYSHTNLRDKLNYIDKLLKSNVIYNTDNYDLITSSKTDILDTDQLYIERWIKSKPNVVMVNFANSFQLNIVNGGLPSLSSRDSLKNNLEASFITHDWHLNYSGGLGYTVSNYPLTQWAPKFHRYSVRIGNNPRPESQVYALHINQYGVQRTIIL